MIQEQVVSDYVLLVEFEPVVPVFVGEDSFSFADEPPEPVGQEEEPGGTLEEEIDDALDGVLDPDIVWCGPLTLEQVLSDPGYIEWTRQREAFDAYFASGSTDLSVFEPWQREQDAQA